MEATLRYIAVLVCSFTLLAQPQKSNEPERWLQSAIQTETVDGDLKSAIEQYKKIIAKSGASREVVAKALVRLGKCYERQGNAEAGKQYERAVREFADQASAVAEARERLAALSGAVTSKSAFLTARQLWTGQDDDGAAPDEFAPAVDGRTLSFVDWSSGDAAIRDLATGQIKRLGLKKSWSESNAFAEFPLYVPDQRQVAYAWFTTTEVGKENPNNRRYQLRVISTESGAKPRVLINQPEFSFFRPGAWSLDGKSILTKIWKKDDTSQIAWVSTADGSFKTLVSTEWRQPGMVSLSPDGRYVAYDALERKDSTNRDIFILAADGTGEIVAVRNSGIDRDPVWTPDGSHLVFTSNRSRNTGLYAIAVQNGQVQGSPKLLKAEVGKIALYRFVRSGALYYEQLTGSQNVYRAELDLSTGKLRNGPLSLGSDYATNNGMSALSPDGKRVAYLATKPSAKAPSYSRGSSGPGASGVIVKALESGIEKLFSVEVDLGWAPMWYPDGDALLLTGRILPAGSGQAFYRLDLNSGRVSTLLQNHVNFKQPGAALGQRELSADGQTVYASVDKWGPNAANLEANGGVFAVTLANGQVRRVYEAKGGVRSVSISPDNRTLAVIADGRLMVMGTDGAIPRTLLESRDVNGNAGVAWSSDGKHVLFVHNGRESEVWRVPVNGGDASPTGISGANIREIRSGPNGALTYTAGRTDQAELWALDNLLPMLKASR